MNFEQLKGLHNGLQNGEILSTILRQILENMELTGLEKAKLSNAKTDAGAYNPDNEEADEVLQEIIQLANENKVTSLIALLKELPQEGSQSNGWTFRYKGKEVPYSWLCDTSRTREELKEVVTTSIDPLDSVEFGAMTFAQFQTRMGFGIYLQRHDGDLDAVREEHKQMAEDYNERSSSAS